MFEAHVGRNKFLQKSDALSSRSSDQIEPVGLSSQLPKVEKSSKRRNASKSKMERMPAVVNGKIRSDTKYTQF